MRPADVTLSPELQRFQAELLEALEGGDPVDVVLARAGAVAPDDAVGAWVASWEPASVELASLLVRTWSVRDGGVGSATAAPGGPERGRRRAD